MKLLEVHNAKRRRETVKGTERRFTDSCESFRESEGCLKFFSSETYTDPRPWHFFLREVFESSRHAVPSLCHVILLKTIIYITLFYKVLPFIIFTHLFKQNYWILLYLLNILYLHIIIFLKRVLFTHYTPS